MSVSNNSSYTTATENFKDSPCTSEHNFTTSLSNQDLIDIPSPSNKLQTSKNMKKNEEKCCICAASHILIACHKPNCHNSFHLPCISGYFPELLPSLICPCHSFKHLEDSKKLLNLSNHFNNSDSLYTKVKNEEISKDQADLTGKFFWFGISLQYFPNTYLKKPEFLGIEISKADSKDPDCWIGKKILNTLNKIETVTESINSELDSTNIKEKSTTGWRKAGENLRNSGKLVWKMQEQMQKNYEKTHEIEELVLRDYHLKQADEGIVCAVCDDGDSIAGNLIVICGTCNVPVHTRCYNIEEVPEEDWLCDPCRNMVSGALCSICPVKGGALKYARPGNWVHVTCGKYLIDSESFEWDLGKIEREKRKLKCFSCKIRTGACVQCQYGRCLTAFHVECRKDLLEHDSEKSFWLCPQHKVGKLVRYLKLEQDTSERFIKKIADSLWTDFKKPKLRLKKFSESIKTTQFNSAPQLDDPLTPNHSQKTTKSEKKTISLNIQPDNFNMRVTIGDKLIRELNYTEVGEVKKKERKTRIKKFKDIQKEGEGEVKELACGEQGIQKKRKRTEKFRILKSKKGEFWIRMKVPSEFVCRKVPRV